MIQPGHIVSDGPRMGHQVFQVLTSDALTWLTQPWVTKHRPVCATQGSALCHHNKYIFFWPCRMITANSWMPVLLLFLWFTLVQHLASSRVEQSDFDPSRIPLRFIFLLNVFDRYPICPRHMKWSVNGVLDDDDSLNWYLVVSSDWVKLRVILVYDDTLNLDHNKQSEGFEAGFCGGFQAHPSIEIMILVYSHMLTHWTRVEIVCDVFWFHGCVWSPPYAKCRVCEDMQVARCLCNFPPAPSERRARCNNNEPVLLMKSNSARGSLCDLKALVTLCGRGSGLPGWAGL